MKKWQKLYNEMRQIASEAITLADSYAGGESETAKVLSKQFEKTEQKGFKLAKEE